MEKNVVKPSNEERRRIREILKKQKNNQLFPLAKKELAGPTPALFLQYGSTILFLKSLIRDNDLFPDMINEGGFQ